MTIDKVAVIRRGVRCIGRTCIHANMGGSLEGVGNEESIK